MSPWYSATTKNDACWPSPPVDKWRRVRCHVGTLKPWGYGIFVLGWQGGRTLTSFLAPWSAWRPADLFLGRSRKCVNLITFWVKLGIRDSDQKYRKWVKKDSDAQPQFDTFLNHLWFISDIFDQNLECLVWLKSLVMSTHFLWFSQKWVCRAPWASRLLRRDLCCEPDLDKFALPSKGLPFVKCLKAGPSSGPEYRAIQGHGGADSGHAGVRAGRGPLAGMLMTPGWRQDARHIMSKSPWMTSSWPKMDPEWHQNDPG